MRNNECRVFLSEQDRQTYPILADCDFGLPILFQWSSSPNGPHHKFDFTRITQGVSEYVVDHEGRDWEAPPHPKELLCIGIYEVEHPFITTHADVCVHRESGDIQIISVNAHNRSVPDSQSDTSYVSIRCEFLNSSIQQLAVSLERYQKMRIEIAANATTVGDAMAFWQEFEHHLQDSDPTVFKRVDSYWGTLVGEALSDEY